MKFLSRSVLAVLLAASAAVLIKPARGEDSKSKPATASATPKPVAKRTGPSAELTKAVAEITKEYTDFAAKPDSGVLRSRSEYFIQNKLTDDTTPEDIIGIIEKSMSSSAPQVAYVKWQLLSGCPSKFEGDQAKRIIAAYRNAPQPFPRFSTDPSIHARLDKMLLGLKPGQEGPINTQVDNEHKRIDPFNDTIIAYRNELYKRLPMNGDSLIARLQDGYIRVRAGIGISAFLKEFESDIRSWTTVGATVSQAQAVLNALRDAATYKGTEVYTAIYYNDKNKTFTWTKPIATFAERPPKTGSPTNIRIEKMLQDYINNPKASEIKFKEK